MKLNILHKSVILFSIGVPLIAILHFPSSLLTQIVVSTDNEEIAIAAEVYGCKPPFIRPKELAEDTSTSLEVVQHAIDFFGQVEYHGNCDKDGNGVDKSPEKLTDDIPVEYFHLNTKICGRLDFDPEKGQKEIIPPLGIVNLTDR